MKVRKRSYQKTTLIIGNEWFLSNNLGFKSKTEFGINPKKWLRNMIFNQFVDCLEMGYKNTKLFFGFLYAI